MVKSSDLLEAAFREVADLRDSGVRDRRASRERLEGLHEAVAAEFSLETALLAQERGRPLPPRWAPSGARLLVRLRSVFQIPETIAVATAILLLFGLLFFEFRHPPAEEVAKAGRGAWVDPPTSRIAEQSRPHGRGDHFLTEPASHLVLQVDATELAKLRSSSLIATRGFSRDRFAANLDLQLELPMRQILSDAERSELP